MASSGSTFGGYISAQRKKLGMSQKQLAEKILREDGQAISAQYLNDIEHDRRSPSSDHLIKEFARVLDASSNYLAYLADRIPADLRRASLSAEAVDKMVAAFRRQGSPKKG